MEINEIKNETRENSNTSNTEGYEIKNEVTVQITENSNISNTDVNEIKNEVTPKIKDAYLSYSIHDRPPWYLCFLLGFQHFVTAFSGIISTPFLLWPLLCSNDVIAFATLVNTGLFVSGLITVLQAVIGIRLPLIHGGSFVFLPPAIAILSLPKWKCENPIYPGGACGMNGEDLHDSNTTENSNADGGWKARLLEIQGAIILSSIVQVFIGLTGAIGFILRFIGPLTIAPTTCLMAVALFRSTSELCAENWAIAIVTIALLLFFSQLLTKFDIPWCKYDNGCSRSTLPVFKLFSITLAILLAWLICWVLTTSNAIPDDQAHWAYGARTDIRSCVLSRTKWFRVPYPGQWGTPTFSLAGTLGMLSGVIAGMFKSTGNYHVTAELAGAVKPPMHAINRGILIEGIGCVMEGLWGTGTGTTEYSQNVGSISITKVGSTRVVIYAGFIMMFLGIFGRFGALFVTIPSPVIGGVFMVLFGIIISVGISNLKSVPMHLPRNMFVFGFSFFFGLSFPQWLIDNPEAIQTGSDVADQVLTTLLSTSMFVGGMIAFLLDNCLPGSGEERGLLVLAEDTADNSTAQLACYDLPFGMSFIKKWRCVRWLPISPTFSGFRRS